MSKVVLVTGASTGLGLGVSIGAARNGHKVYATMRDLSKRAALDAAAMTANVQINLLTLDVQKINTIESAVAHIIDAEGHIDCVVNNAGMGFVRSTEQATLGDAERVMDVNFMGVLRLTKVVLPHMRENGSGHFINISSVGGLVGQPFNEIYCASKFAVEGYTEALASYVQGPFGIKFTLVEPGGIQSEFANSAMKQVNETGGILQDAYLPILQNYMSGMKERGMSAFQTVQQVAAEVLNVMENPEPPLRIRTSPWAEDFANFKTGLDPDGTKSLDMVVKRFLGN